MKKALISFFVLFLVAFTLETFAQKTVDVVATSAAKTPPSAKFSVPTQDVAAAKPDPTRAECCLNFDNWTGYWINVWVDGTYKGQVAPWSDGYVCVGEGWTTWYAETSGKTYYWNGSGKTCRGDWNLRLE